MGSSDMSNEEGVIMEIGRLLAMPEYRTRRALAAEIERVVSLGLRNVLDHQDALRIAREAGEAHKRVAEQLERELHSVMGENTTNETEMYRWQGQALAYRRVMRDLLENDGMELL